MTISSRVETWCAKLVHPGCWSSPGYAYVYIYNIYIYIHMFNMSSCFTRRIREKKNFFIFVAMFISWVTFSHKRSKWNEERHGWPPALRLLPVVAFGSPDGDGDAHHTWVAGWECFPTIRGFLMMKSLWWGNPLQFLPFIVSLGVIIRNSGFLDMYMKWIFMQLILFPCIVNCVLFGLVIYKQLFPCPTAPLCCGVIMFYQPLRRPDLREQTMNR